MISFLNSKFTKLSIRSKYLIICLISLCADITVLFYAADLVKATLYRLSPSKITGLFELSAAQIELLQDEQFINLFVSTLQSILSLFILFNITIYLSCIFQKKWAIKYVQVYLLSGVIFSGIELVIYITRFQDLNVYTCISLLIYFISYSLMKKTKTA